MHKPSSNPIRRNRNIGTAKQGYGQDNKLTIAQPSDTLLSFYERLNNPQKSSITVHNKSITVLIEELHPDYFYSFTPQEAEELFNALPREDFEDFGLLIFRQAKKKEQTLNPVWGRLIYSYEYHDELFPAIIIESCRKSWSKFYWPKKQCLDDKREFELLQEDGLKFKMDKRRYIADLTPKLIRNIQLYRTLLHELGHYVHYLSFVERPGHDNENFNEWERRYDDYFKLPVCEKESFANNYALATKQILVKNGLVKSLS